MNFSLHAVVATMFFLLGLAQAVEVNVTLDTQIVQTGDAAHLSIRVSGGDSEKPVLPEVKNLTVQYQGQSRQISIINGRTESSFSHNYIIGSPIAGDYQIPPIEVTVSGKKYLTKALRLTVVGNGKAAAVPNPEELARQEADPRRFGFLTVELTNQNRKHAYVGEIAPVRIRAWLPRDARASLRSGIQPESQGFTLQNVSQQPQQNAEVLDGKQYQVLTWFGGITATKAGNLPASLSLKAVVAVPDLTKPVLRQRRSGSLFDDAFRQSNVSFIEKEVTLTSQDQTMEVRSLPTTGRPANFAGAVGDFQFDAVEIPPGWQTGEPQKVALRLKGSGNFSSVKAPPLTPAEVWTCYPGQEQFTPGDNASFAGSKVFQYNAVARKHGTFDAGFSFAYFDPDQGQYKEIQSQTVNIQVSGDDLPEEKPLEENLPPNTPEKPTDSADQPAPLRDKLSPARSLVPLSQSPSFISVLGAMAVVTLLGPLVFWVRKYRLDPQRQSRKALQVATRSALQSADKCVAAQDVPGFFAAARMALQQQLGGLWQQSPQAITFSEVQSRLGLDSPVTAFFREADHQTYGAGCSAESLPQWQSLLRQACSRITSLAGT